MKAEKGYLNEDREIWRLKKGDYYSPSISVTKDDGISINVGGTVITLPIERWHQLITELDIKTLENIKGSIVLDDLTAQLEAVTKERDELKETLEFMTNIMSLTGNEARRMAQKALAKMEGKK